MRIIFAGGGTAGHVNPAIAVANYMKSRDPSCEIYFSGAKGKIEEKLCKAAGYKLFAFEMTGLSRSLSAAGIKQNVRAVKSTLSSLSEAKKVLRSVNPDIVVGTGGYASFPMVSAAQSLGIKTAVLEVNVTPGVTTKKLAKRAKCVMVSFEESIKLIGTNNIVLTGNPVRQEIVDCKSRSYKPIFASKRPIVTVFWGSVGALYMNKKMIDFVKLAAEKKEINLIFATGESHFKMVKDGVNGAAKAENIDIREYIMDMDRALALSDLVICRGGGSLSELCIVGRAAIVVPSPYVSDNHQEKNARLLEGAGVCKVITEQESTGEGLYKAAVELISDPELLMKMERAALLKAQPQALENIYNAIMRVAK